MFGVLLYYITMNEEIQSKLQDDIDELFEGKEPGEELSQDEVTGMKYLDQVDNSSDLSQLDSVPTLRRL